MTQRILHLSCVSFCIAQIDNLIEYANMGASMSGYSPLEHTARVTIERFVYDAENKEHKDAEVVQYFFKTFVDAREFLNEYFSESVQGKFHKPISERKSFERGFFYVSSESVGEIWRNANMSKSNSAYYDTAYSKMKHALSKKKKEK